MSSTTTRFKVVLVADDSKADAAVLQAGHHRRPLNKETQKQNSLDSHGSKSYVAN
jgi:hypothetical protein